MTLSRITLVGLLLSAPVSACSTCFGDPDSQMVKGAVMGVYVLVGVVSFVLVGIAGTGLFWIHRSRSIGRDESASLNTAEDAPPRRGGGR